MQTFFPHGTYFTCTWLTFVLKVIIHHGIKQKNIDRGRFEAFTDFFFSKIHGIIKLCQICSPRVQFWGTFEVYKNRLLRPKKNP